MIKNYLFWNLIDLLNSEYNLPKNFSTNRQYWYNNFLADIFHLFFVTGYNIRFIPLGAEITFLKTWLKIKQKMILPHICNMRVLIISCSSSLFGSIFSRIFSTWEIWTCTKKSQSFPMPYSVNVTFDKDLSVLSKTLGGVLMLLLIKGTLFDKKSELNNSAFCLKSLINLFTWKSDIFLLFRKDLR